MSTEIPPFSSEIVESLQRPYFLEPGATPAHPEDSIALSEHVPPEFFAAKITRTSEILTSYYELLLRRAHYYYELALSTPAIDQDMGYFDSADKDLRAIVDSDLAPKHRVRFNADLLGIYKESFVARAFDDPISPEIRENLRTGISGYTEDFVTDTELTPSEQGQLAELVAIGYVLRGDHFPFIGLYREEANMISEDNHDIYTISTSTDNPPSKAPISVKFREIEQDTQLISLPIGRIALATARAIPSIARNYTGKESHARSVEALRYAADIMICDANGDKLSVEDKAFLWTMTACVQAPIDAYSEGRTPPDYAANAQLIYAKSRA